MKKLLIFLIVVALALTGVAYYTKHSTTHNGEANFPTAKAEFGELKDIISVNAALRPFEVKPVFTMVAGQVVAINADNGGEVSEGDVLARLDPRQAQLKKDEANANLLKAKAAVAAAQAEVGKAEASREGAQKFLDKLQGVGGSAEKAKAEGLLTVAQKTVTAAQKAVDLAKSSEKLAETALAEANLGLKLTTVRVPIFEFADGKANNPALGQFQLEQVSGRPKRKFIVLSRKIEPGQNVDTKEPLFILAAGLEQMQAHASIPESQITRVARGQKAQLWVDALGEEHKMNAAVTEIRLVPAPQQGPQSATYYEALLNIKNEKDARTGAWNLRSGMSAQVEIVHQIHANVWKLPVNAKNFVLDEQYQTPEAKAHAKEREEKLDMRVWTKVWILKDNNPWPIFVRTGGVNADGEPGINDHEFYEILEWDAEVKPLLDPKQPPDVIIGAPPARKSLFEFPNIKF